MRDIASIREENFASVQVGATVQKDRDGGATRVWTVTSSRRSRDRACVILVLRHGRREFKVWVPICFYGPVLDETGLRSVRPAPEQRALLSQRIGGAS